MTLRTSKSGKAAAADDAERHAYLVGVLGAIAEALREAVPSSTEIVVHDLRRMEESIVAIVNGQVTGRAVGDGILQVPTGDRGLTELTQMASDPGEPRVKVIGGYVSRARDGRELRSTSVIIRDLDGRPAAGFCLNVDLTGAQMLFRQVQSLLFPAPANEEGRASEPGERSTIEELIEEIIRDAVGSSSLPVERMRKEEKMAAVAEMSERGIFLIKGSVERVAAALGTTKFTIYNYLDELDRKHRPDAE
jgi:predicted transcriptional regulator YheO